MKPGIFRRRRRDGSSGQVQSPGTEASGQSFSNTGSLPDDGSVTPASGTVVTDGGTVKTRRRRGRPSGSRNKPKTKMGKMRKKIIPLTPATGDKEAATKEGRKKDRNEKKKALKMSFRMASRKVKLLKKAYHTLVDQELSARKSYKTARKAGKMPETVDHLKAEYRIIRDEADTAYVHLREAKKLKKKYRKALKKA